MERFFYEACRVSEIEVKEMLLRRYHDINYILRMPFKEFIEFLNLAKEKERESRIFFQWVAQLPFMSSENYLSFEDYKAKLTGANIDKRSTKELLEEADEIEKMLEGSASRGT